MNHIKCICGAELRAPVIGEVWASDNGSFYVVEQNPGKYTPHFRSNGGYYDSDTYRPWWSARRINTIGKLVGCDPSAVVALWPIAIRERRWTLFAASVDEAVALLKELT